MADSFVLLNDGSSFVVLNDGTSKVILNVSDVVSEGSSGGGIFKKAFTRFRKHPPQVQMEYQEFYKPIRATATLSKTNEISFKSIPLLRQHMMKWFIVKPTISENQEIPIRVNPTKEKHIHIAKIYCKLRSLLWVHNAEIFMNVRPKMDDYFTTDIHGKSLNGINIIRKAMKMSEVKTFEFRVGVDELQDLMQPKSLRKAVTSDEINKVWGELKIKQRRELLETMKLDVTLAELEFDRLPPDVKTIFRDMDKNELLELISLVVGLTLLTIFLNILSVPKRDFTDREPNFTHSSSWVGKVTYTPDFNTMEITMGAKVYGFCGVPERVFNEFEASPSKGKYYNRAIKDRFNC